MNQSRALLEAVSPFYARDEYPALDDQFRRWEASRPLAGLRVLDGSPLFTNTLVKHAALLAGGAELFVHTVPAFPFDPWALAKAHEFGIREAGEAELAAGFDVVLDNGGFHAHVPSRLGYVELTRTGAAVYRGHAGPVFLADEGRIKTIETGLGTGDGFVRAMDCLGHGAFEGRTVVVFGGGKVGRGIAARALERGARVVVVDRFSGGQVRLPGRLENACLLIDAGDFAAIAAALGTAWCAVSATGVKGALDDPFLVPRLVASPALLANMGVEDEFGPGVPAGRVLAQKQTLNFILKEPTHLKYIDPTLALHNEGAVELLAGGYAPGINHPPPELENRLLGTVLRNGVIAPELRETFGELL